ncbi:MAG: hypothetical protein CM1200mP20_04780 [Pseudomonadota bacterium]|nr:MAG: hypothetical protein CM1200mP20_04780 [Pseudomonadota bacterium]
MLWIKAFHIIFMVTWFAGLFYLPRLFVYPAMTEEPGTTSQFKVMERKLYFWDRDSRRHPDHRFWTVALARVWHWR